MNQTGERRSRIRSRGRRALALTAAGAFLGSAACGGDSTGPDDDGTAQDVVLSVGGSQVVTPTASGVLRFRLPAPGASGAEYRMQVQSAARTAGATSMRLTLGGGTSASAARASSGLQRAASSRDGWTVRDLEPGSGGEVIRQRLRRRTARMLYRRGIRPSDGRRGVRASSMLPSGETPQQGDTLRFWFDVGENQRATCDSLAPTTKKVTGRVRAVGSRVAVVEDTLVEDGGTLTGGMDYQALADEFDNSVFGTNAAYFGTPSDIDGNSRVLVLFTNAVNEFSAQQTGGSGSPFVLGFFNPVDMADSGDPAKDGSQNVASCETSNEAEVMWLIAPDPDGSTGEQLDVPQATEFARSTSGHEFQHMLNTGNRLIKAGGNFNDVEDTWLDEGLSHLAEEVIGLTQSGVSVRDNLTLSDVTGSAEQDSIFNTFLAGDFTNLSEHLGEPAATLALNLDDPGSPETFPMRGNAWMLVRWLADQFGPASGGDGLPGAGEDLLIEELAAADGSLETGIANVEAATGEQWQDLLADYGAALAVDDVPEVSARQQVLTWDLRGLFESSNLGTYPLASTTVGFQPGSFDFSAQAGAGRYFFVRSEGSAPDVTLEVTDQTGQPLTAGNPQVTIVRVR